jgi:hypothetical protein
VTATSIESKKFHAIVFYDVFFSIKSYSNRIVYLPIMEKKFNSNQWNEYVVVCYYWSDKDAACCVLRKKRSIYAVLNSTKKWLIEREQSPWVWLRCNNRFVSNGRFILSTGFRCFLSCCAINPKCFYHAGWKHAVFKPINLGWTACDEKNIVYHFIFYRRNFNDIPVERLRACNKKVECFWSVLICICSSWTRIFKFNNFT